MCAVSQRYSNRNVQVIIIIIRWHALQTAQLSPGLSAINISLGTHCHAERRPTLHWWTFSSTVRNPGDHSPDNVKFSDNSLTVRGTRYVKCYSYHARTSTKYLYGCKYAAYNKQFLATFPWQDLLPDSSLTFSKIPDSSLTAVKYPDISRFSRQVVTLETRFAWMDWFGDATRMEDCWWLPEDHVYGPEMGWHG